MLEYGHSGSICRRTTNFEFRLRLMLHIRSIYLTVKIRTSSLINRYWEDFELLPGGSLLFSVRMCMQESTRVVQRTAEASMEPEAPCVGDVMLPSLLQKAWSQQRTIDSLPRKPEGDEIGSALQRWPLPSYSAQVSAVDNSAKSLTGTTSEQLFCAARVRDMSESMYRQTPKMAPRLTSYASTDALSIMSILLRLNPRKISKGRVRLWLVPFIFAQMHPNVRPYPPTSKRGKRQIREATIHPRASTAKTIRATGSTLCHDCPELHKQL